MVIARLLEHKMHMARPIRVAPQLLKQLSDRPIMRNRIRHGHDRLEPKHALAITAQDRAAVGPLAVRMLHVVEALAVSLPDVDFHALHGFPVRVFYAADDEAGLPLAVVRDGAAVRLVGRLVRVERA